MSDERRYPPTTKRRREARSEGQVVQSPELGSAGTVLIGGLVLQAGALVALVRFGDILRESFDRAAIRSLDLDSAGAFLTLMGAESMLLLLPALLILLVTGVAISLAQVRPLLALRAVRPKLERINPVPRLRGLFATTNTLAALVGLAKPFVLGALLVRLFVEYAGLIADLAGMPPEVGVQVIGDLGRDLLVQCGIALLLFALADFGLRYRQHEQALRMTRRELEDERRQEERGGGRRTPRGGVQQSDPITASSETAAVR